MLEKPRSAATVRALALVVVPLVSARGQPDVRPLTPAEVATRPLRPMTDTMSIVLVRDGVRRDGGRFVVTLAATALGGRRTYLAIAHDLPPTGSPTFDTTAVDATTLEPLWHRTHALTDSAAVEYRGRAATGYAAHEKHPPSPIHTRLTTGAFESAIVGWLLPELPLRDGYAISVASFSPWETGEDTTTYRVIGSETLALISGPVDTWVIQEVHGPEDRALRKRWIDKTSHRTLQTYDAPPRPAALGDGYWKISVLVNSPPSK